MVPLKSNSQHPNAKASNSGIHNLWHGLAHICAAGWQNPQQTTTQTQMHVAHGRRSASSMCRAGRVFVSSSAKTQGYPLKRRMAHIIIFQGWETSRVRSVVRTQQQQQQMSYRISSDMKIWHAIDRSSEYLKWLLDASKWKRLEFLKRATLLMRVPKHSMHTIIYAIIWTTHEIA